MKGKYFITTGIVLILIFGAILIPQLMENNNSDDFIFVAEDSLGPWYFDKSSIEERYDQVEGISVIDVWVKHDIDQEGNICVRDELLWHIDPAQMRYKFSDAFAFDEAGYLIEA
ncbi:hypothetical protein [Gudongella sp. SC589]|jgi:hypothetical protein|uniref:hypothetical protein n=1 Tax=Gudongella sp. SC589 TaxID=3385990 RepID=UPI0039049D84